MSSAWRLGPLIKFCVFRNYSSFSLILHRNDHVLQVLYPLHSQSALGSFSSGFCPCSSHRLHTTTAKKPFDRSLRTLKQRSTHSPINSHPVLSRFNYQWPTGAMLDFFPWDDGLEYQADSSEDYEVEDQPGSSENDQMEHQPNTFKEDGSESQPTSSSEGDESDGEPRRPHKSNNSIRIHQKSIALSQCHLRADTDLKSGTVISIGQTLELHDGSSFLTVTELRRFKNGGLMFFGYLFRRVEEFQDYLLVTSGGTELVWLCEATEHDPKPGGYLRSARSQDVLRIRHLVPTNSDSVSESFPQLGAVGTTTNTKPLFFQWRLVAELSKPNITRGPRNFSSAMKGTQGQPKAFVALSSQEPLLGGITTIAFCNSHHHLDSDLPKPSSDDGSSQPKMHARAIGRNPATEKEHCRNVLAPTTNGNRTSIGKCSPAIHKPSDHLAESLGRMLKISPPRRRVSGQGIEPRIYTFADGFCGAGGMSKGAENAGLLIVWAFDQDADAIKTYSLNHGKDSCKQMSAESFLESRNAYGTSEVDVLHVSPPCQGFTLACRGLPRNVKKDNECMTYVGKVVKKVNPRIVTFEQVREVLSKDQGYFKSMVLDLTSIGYSISWRILECADFGVPQRRRRLFVIASRSVTSKSSRFSAKDIY